MVKSGGRFYQVMLPWSNSIMTTFPNTEKRDIPHVAEYSV